MVDLFSLRFLRIYKFSWQKNFWLRDSRRQADVFSCFMMSIDGRINKVQDWNSWYCWKRPYYIDKMLQSINHENGMNHQNIQHDPNESYSACSWQSNGVDGLNVFSNKVEGFPEVKSRRRMSFASRPPNLPTSPSEYEKEKNKTTERRENWKPYLHIKRIQQKDCTWTQMWYQHFRKRNHENVPPIWATIKQWKNWIWSDKIVEPWPASPTFREDWMYHN